MRTDMLLILALGVALLLATLYRQRRRDAVLTAPFEARLSRHGIKVRAVSPNCDYCRGRQIRLSRLVRIEPKPGSIDLGLLQELPIGEFCTLCGAEELSRHDKARGRVPRNLQAFMDDLDAEEGTDVR